MSYLEASQKMRGRRKGRKSRHRQKAGREPSKLKPIETLQRLSIP